MLNVVHHPNIPDDLSGIQKTDVKKILDAIEKKLVKYPELFGVPLRGLLHEYWKLRVGDYRVIYQTTRGVVYIFAVGDRKLVYRLAGRRLG